MSHIKTRIMGIFGILLILFFIAFAALPLIPNSTLGVIRIIARQRTIEQLIVKDVLILAYRPTSEHVQAISELQNSLPVWEKVEAGLQNGDDSLGISPNLPPEVKALILQAQSDFTSIDTAAHQILAHPSQVDQTQLLIILQHERAYSLTLFQVSSLFEDHIHAISQVYFGIGVAISIGLLLIWIRFFRALLRAEREKEEDN
jgi:MFS superfamily sulfate permease-like transporter